MAGASSVAGVGQTLAWAVCVAWVCTVLAWVAWVHKILAWLAWIYKIEVVRNFDFVKKKWLVPKLNGVSQNKYFSGLYGFSAILSYSTKIAVRM